MLLCLVGGRGIVGLYLSIDVSIAWLDVYKMKVRVVAVEGASRPAVPLGALRVCCWDRDCLVSRSSWMMRRHRFSPASKWGAWHSAAVRRATGLAQWLPAGLARGWQRSWEDARSQGDSWCNDTG